MMIQQENMSLKNLCEEFEVAIRLCQYNVVSSLSSKINIHLVELIDSFLINENASDVDDQESAERFIGVKFNIFVERLCRKLRNIGEIAFAYDEVCNFVRLQDMNSLSKIIGALKPEEIKGHVLNPYVPLMKIVQQCIMLLRSMRQNHDEWEIASRSGFIDAREIRRIIKNPLGFATYQIDDIENLLSPAQNVGENDELGSTLIEQLNSLESDHFPNDHLESELKSGWFVHFVDKHMDNRLPIDRFTILVAIWIAGVECQCNSMDSIMDHLVDGLVHEEAASSGVDDFMQLSQLGSIWLSERRRLKVSTIANNNNNIDSNTDTFSYKSADSDVDSGSESDSGPVESGSSSTSSNDKLVSSFNQTEVDVFNGINTTHNKFKRSSKDLKKELRQLIEDGFLHGYECPVCSDKQSGKLLASLEFSSCSNCSSQLTVERCSLSFRPIKIIRLESLLGFRPRARSLTLVSGSEWLRFYIKESSLLDLHMSSKQHIHDSFESNDTENKNWSHQASERVQISEDFQKLTVIRPNENNHEDQMAKSSSSDDDTADKVDYDDKIDNPAEEFGKNTPDEPWYHRMLTSLMIAKHSRRLDPKGRNLNNSMDGPSESLQATRYAGYDATKLFLNMCDLVIMDSNQEEPIFDIDCVRVGLVVSDSWRCWGPIMSCSSRSEVSQLQIGCGRLLCSFELLKTGQQHGAYTCPFCSQDLIQLRSLNQILSPY